jgi:PTS system glucitol/sorbitol-specific IIA component
VICGVIMLKYQATISAIGPLVQDFLNEGIIVLFGQQAPEELQEFAILHDGKTLHAPLEAGDRVSFDDTSYRVLAVGDVVNENLANLGHLVLKCNGQSQPEMPGDVCVESKPPPTLRVGMTLRIESAQQ